MGAWAILLLSMLVLAHAVHAQDADTTSAAPPDTALAAATEPEQRPVPAGPPMPYAAAEWGEAVLDTLPILQPALDATELLTRRPGSFVYRLGPVGWPDGWSPEGMSPQRPALALAGLPFDDPVTGRPRYDLLPLAWLEPPRVAPTRFGAPHAVHTTFRPYVAAEPLTELRYRTRANGLQSIMAVHVQRRRLVLFDTSGIVQLLGGYGGHASQGEYPGSRLRRMRQLYGRIRYAQPSWSVEISNLHNRRHLDAHAGVFPADGQPYAAIYDRFSAQVRQPDAQRRIIRNDLSLTARSRLLPALEAPLTLTAFWTAQTFRYTETDTVLSVQADRYGLRAYQDVEWRDHALSLRLDARLDRLDRTNAGASPATDARVHLTLLDSTRLFGIDVAAEATLNAADDMLPLTGRLSLSRGDARGRLFIEGVYAGQPVPWVARYGFGETLSPLDDLPLGRVARARAGASVHLGPLDAGLTAFAHHATQPFDYYAAATDTFGVAAAHVAELPFRRVGAVLDLGLRRDAERGFYLTLRPAVTHVIDASRTARSPEGPVAHEHERLAASVPLVHARGRLGMRYLLFQGDLDLDLYLRGEAWSSFRSRAFHAPTGLLVLPQTDARTIGPSGTLDVVAEAGIRTAILFLAYENVLAGRAYHGTLLVPDYPLPEQRFRIGVYWPIFG